MFALKKPRMPGFPHLSPPRSVLMKFVPHIIGIYAGKGHLGIGQW